MKTRIHQHFERHYVHGPHIRYFVVSMLIALVLTLMIVIFGYGIIANLTQ